MKARKESRNISINCTYSSLLSNTKFLFTCLDHIYLCKNLISKFGKFYERE